MYRILELNPQLQNFAGDIDLRMRLYRDTKARILGQGQTQSIQPLIQRFFHHP